jgi:putative PIN family toxin of toxin-antitoxin system
LRAVLDTNVLISGLIAPRGSPGRLLAAWREGRFDLVVSPALLAEARRALGYPKLARRVSPDDAEAFVGWLGRAAILMEDPSGPPPVRSGDPDDDFVIALAAAGGAHLVSGDATLLALADRAPVVSPAEFVALLARERV